MTSRQESAWRAAELAVLYSAGANILSFGVSRLNHPMPPNVLFAIVSQLITVIAAAVFSAAAARRPHGDVLGLTAAALIVGLWMLSISDLLAAIFVLATIRSIPDCSDDAFRYGSVVLLLLVPFLSEPRPQWGLPPVPAAGLAVVVGLLIALAMRRRGALFPATRAAACVVASLAGLACARVSVHAFSVPVDRSGVAQERSAPNVILITMDAVRADHTSLYGYPVDTTPNLRRVFESSASLYLHAYASGDFTLTSHASIVTGLLALHHGAHPQPKGTTTGISCRCPTIAERLRNAGYVTVGLAANSGYLDRQWGFDRGFDYYNSAPASGRLAAAHSKPYFIGPAVAMAVRSAVPADYHRPFRSAAEITDEALNALTAVHASKRGRCSCSSTTWTCMGSASRFAAGG